MESKGTNSQQSKTTKQLGSSKAPILRDGNKAYEVDRPLFDQPELEKTFPDVKNMLLQKLEREEKE